MKKLAILYATLGLAGALSTGAALAQSNDTLAKFTALDVDQSALISFEELTVLIPELTAEQFAAADVDATGELDQAEFVKMVETLSE